MAEKNDALMEKLVSLCKRRGFVYQGSEIYGGLAGTWDYGPLGVELKNNIKQLWWRMFVQDRDDMYGVDAAILMHPKVWESSGHVEGFSDPLIECTNCKNRFRIDTLVDNTEDYFQFLNEAFRTVITPINEKNDSYLLKFKSLLDLRSKKKLDEKETEELFRTQREANVSVTTTSHLLDEVEKARKFEGFFTKAYLNMRVNCPVCNHSQWGKPRRFNMMFKTSIGAIDDGESVSYLRPETAGGIFVNFKNVVDSLHPKLPFGIGQIGKAFRNEIAPRDFIFRVRELEQMEVEYFVKESEWEGAFEEWRKAIHAFAEKVGIAKQATHELEVAPEDRAHYSKRTIDFEFDFPFGRKELFGLAYRTDFDLSAHQKGSGADLSYFDEETKERFVPHVIEPSLGVERSFLAILASAYTEDEMGGETRVYLKFKPSVAPVKAAVFPLLKNKPELVAKAREVYQALKKEIPQVMWDDNGNVGKRYRRQDEIGTPYCITIDFDTLGEKPELLDTVTLRDRDTGQQERIAITELAAKLKESLV